MIGVKYWMKKENIKKPGTNVAWFTLRWITFNPKKCVVNTDEAKNEIRKWMKKSRAELDNEYDVIYARAEKSRKMKGLVTEYSICVKPFSNTIFVIPKKHRKEARKAISELTVEGNFTFN